MTECVARKEGDLIVVDLPQVATGGGGVSKEQEPTAYLCENAVGHKYFRWKKPSSEYKPIALYTAPPQREWETLVESVRQMRDVQGMDGNWNCDPYMHGLFNGLEFALSLIEVREPKFRDTPQKWLSDLPKPRIFSEKGEHMNIEWRWVERLPDTPIRLKKKWQGLTTPEIRRIASAKELWLDHEDGRKLFDWDIFARVIEAKLKEKNGG